MPLYEYHCKKCGADFEEMVSFANADKVECIECGSNQVERLMSTFACSMSDGGMGSGDFMPSCGASA